VALCGQGYLDTAFVADGFDLGPRQGVDDQGALPAGACIVATAEHSDEYRDHGQDCRGCSDERPRQAPARLLGRYRPGRCGRLWLCLLNGLPNVSGGPGDRERLLLDVVVGCDLGGGTGRCLGVGHGRSDPVHDCGLWHRTGRGQLGWIDRRGPIFGNHVGAVDGRRALLGARNLHRPGVVLCRLRLLGDRTRHGHGVISTGLGEWSEYRGLVLHGDALGVIGLTALGGVSGIGEPCLDHPVAGVQLESLLEAGHRCDEIPLRGQLGGLS